MLGIQRCKMISWALDATLERFANKQPLEELLRHTDLPARGRRRELVARIVEALDEEQIDFARHVVKTAHKSELIDMCDELGLECHDEHGDPWYADEIRELLAIWWTDWLGDLADCSPECDQHVGPGPGRRRSKPALRVIEGGKQTRCGLVKILKGLGK